MVIYHNNRSTFKWFDSFGVFRMIDCVADESFGGIFHRRHDVTDLASVKNVHGKLVGSEYADLLQWRITESRIGMSDLLVNEYRGTQWHEQTEDWKFKERVPRHKERRQELEGRISQSQSQNKYTCTHGHTWTVCVFLEWYPCNLSPTLSDPCWSVIKVTTPLNCRNQESNIKALNGSSKLPAISYERTNI